jgi:hypothetical protein
MRQLYELAKTPIKVWKPLPEGDHNGTVAEPGYFEAIVNFIADLEPRTEKEKVLEES